MQEVGPTQRETDTELSIGSPPSQVHRDSQVEGVIRRIATRFGRVV